MNGRRLIMAALMTASMAGSIALAQPEVPATLTGQPDSVEEHMIPVNLIRGRISNQPQRYILGPGDTISLKIKDLENFNQEFTIRPDGYGTVHPFGELSVSGTDVQGLQAWLEEKFKYYLVKPEVSIDVVEMRPALVYISGAVQKPGTYQYIRKGLSNSNILAPVHEKVELTLTNILAKAGGVTEYADISNIRVTHSTTGIEEVYDLRKFLAGGPAEQDIWLQAGDTITVPMMEQQMDPETFKLVSNSSFYRDKFPVVVLGAVVNQGEVQLDPKNNTMNAAIALAGGFVPKLSKTDKIILQRPTNNGTFSRWIIDREKANMALQPGDVLYVHNSKYSDIERAIELLVRTSEPFFFSAAGFNNINNLSK